MAGWCFMVSSEWAGTISHYDNETGSVASDTAFVSAPDPWGVSEARLWFHIQPLQWIGLTVFGHAALPGK